MKQPRIIFMGTPEFAVASLKKLYEANYQIVGVVTAPDKPAGRGMKLTESAVKQYAVLHNLKILQPLKLKDPEFLKELASLNADLQIVVAFRMLPEVVWDMPLMGTLNLHGSLLPQYRGAAPINWAIIQGEKKTGVTTFKLKHEIDTGNILLQKEIPIGEKDTAGIIHDVMKETGADLLLETVEGLVNGTIRETEQATADVEGLKHAPKIFTETCEIDWRQPIENIYNLIRGLSPYPAAFSNLHGKKLKIFQSEKENVKHSLTAGSFESDGKSYLKFAAADGFIHVVQIQLEGKKQMGIQEFLRGYKINTK